MPTYRRPSTTATPRREKIKAARRGHVASPSEARSIVFQPGNHRAPVTVTLQLMPGAEPWVRIVRQGAAVRIPATCYVWELLLRLHGWEA